MDTNIKCKVSCQRGYAQAYGIDYEETFSLVARDGNCESNNCFMATTKGLSLNQMDVKKAFVHGNS